MSAISPANSCEITESDYKNASKMIIRYLVDATELHSPLESNEIEYFGGYKKMYDCYYSKDGNKVTIKASFKEKISKILPEIRFPNGSNLVYLEKDHGKDVSQHLVDSALSKELNETLIKISNGTDEFNPDGDGG